MAFVSRMIGRPDDVRRYDRQMRSIKLAFLLIVVGVAAVIAGANLLDWLVTGR
jgi:hypothetical protein